MTDDVNDDLNLTKPPTKPPLKPKPSHHNPGLSMLSTADGPWASTTASSPTLTLTQKKKLTVTCTNGSATLQVCLDGNTPSAPITVATGDTLDITVEIPAS